MTAFYDKLAATSLKLLTKYGRAVTLRRPAAGATYDTATSSVVPGGVASDTVLRGAPFDFKSGETETAGGLVKAGDKSLLLQATSPRPTVADQVLIGAEAWEVLDAQTVSPGGTDVLHRLHIRR